MYVCPCVCVSTHECACTQWPEDGVWYSLLSFSIYAFEAGESLDLVLMFALLACPCDPSISGPSGVHWVWVCHLMMRPERQSSWLRSQCSEPWNHLSSLLAAFEATPKLCVPSLQFLLALFTTGFLEDKDATTCLKKSSFDPCED